MKHYKKYAARPRRAAPTKHAKGTPKKFDKIKPGADARLKKVFAAIGVPEKSEFKPDPFQLEALDAVADADCLVTAPTGAGKTWIAEKAIRRIFEAGGNAWYASPLKALTNAKYKEFSVVFNEKNVGILTGDRKENADASIIIGTTEILRNQLYDAMHQGRSLNTDFVVLDEAHFLGDTDRGVVWEEILIYLPRRIPILMLSATIGNARQIAGWLSAIRERPCRVVEETKRPVPLYPLFFHPSGTLLPLLTAPDAGGKTRIYKKVSALVRGKQPADLAGPGKLPPFGDILRVLKKYNLLPAIFFLKSRANCDQALEMCANRTDTESRRSETRRIRIETLIGDHPHIFRHRQRWHLENLGVGAHHSGQFPAWKLVIESLMAEGLLDAVFATSTVAAGVNFPARTVVFLNSDRFNGTQFVPLNPTELLQMTGRAGRRGMDQIGFALAIPGKFMDISRVARLFASPPGHVVSQIRINFSMVLNLLLSHHPHEIKELLQKSFAAHLIRHAGRKSLVRMQMTDSQRYLWDDFSRHIDFLKETDFVDDDDRLTTDGMWASQLRIDQPLMVAEALRTNLFPETEPALFAAVIAAFVNEKETDEHFERRAVPKSLINSLLKLRKGLRPFSRHMMISGFPVRDLYIRPSAAVHDWACGLSWEKITSKYGIPEGDFSMLVLRTVDNLRHIRSLSTHFPDAAATAKTAIDLILRSPVLTEI